MSVWVITAPSSQMASAAEMIVATRRLRGETLLVTSSVMPAANAGRLQASSSHREGAAGDPRTWAIPTPTTIAIITPRPPTRGTGRAWNFCGPLRSWSADRWPCRIDDRMMRRVASRPTRKQLAK